MSKASIPLDMISVASPCHAAWEDMAGDDQSRFCGQCSKYVYNLSAMTAGEAQTLIEKQEGTMCARFFKRRDGTMLTADCPIGWRAAKTRFVLIGAAASTLLFALLSAVTLGALAFSTRNHAGLGGANWRNPIVVIRDILFPPPEPMVMGEICVPLGPPIMPLPPPEDAPN